jgi:hypothetical protein
VLRLKAVVLSVLAAALALRASAQRPVAVEPGRMVRIVTTDGSIVTGEFVGLRRDTALIAMAHVVPARGSVFTDQERAARIISLRDIQSYEVQTRTKGWAIYGALAGGGLGLAILSVARANDRHWEVPGLEGSDPNTRKLARPVALALTAAGAMVGALIGPKKWVVPNDVRATLDAAPTGMGMAVSVRF